MTDRINALTVVLEDNVRADDAEFIINAIRAIRRVVAVEPHVADIGDEVARQQVKSEIRDKILELWKNL